MWRTLPPGRWTDYYTGIAGAIRDGTAAPVTAASAIETMRVLEAAQRSAAQGCVVAL